MLPASVRRLRGAVLAVLSAVLLTALVTGCTADVEAGSGARTNADLGAVEITGAQDSPKVMVPTPFTVTKTERRVISQGKGPIVARGQRIEVNYSGVNGADGQVFDTTYGRTDRKLVLDQPAALKGWISGLAGVTVGSRVLIAVPPAEGYGVEGVSEAGIGSTDTLVFLIDVKASTKVITRAAGETVKPKSGLPKVKLAKDGEPSITVPDKKPPTKLITQTLIKGTGAEVKKKQRIYVRFVGVIWDDDRVFYNSWKKNDAPLPYSMGVGRVIAGWDEGLIGKTVGSQVLMVVPPDKGYGANGQADLNIKGTDTLVFVVDILEAADLT